MYELLPPALWFYEVSVWPSLLDSSSNIHQYLNSASSDAQLSPSSSPADSAYVVFLMLKFGNPFQAQPSECNEAEDLYLHLTLGWCGKCRVPVYRAGIILQSPLQCNLSSF